MANVENLSSTVRKEVGHEAYSRFRPILYKKSSRIARNFRRKVRRRKSVLKYYSYLKDSRRKRRAEDLCSSVSVLGISDINMDCVPLETFTTFNDPMTEVTEWHKHEQLAYWKSRALSLEYENKMLQMHLRNAYLSQIQMPVEDEMSKPKHSVEHHKTRKGGNGRLHQHSSNETLQEITTKMDEIERKKEMFNLYGNEAPKILGMETAIHLNYQHHIEQSNVTKWPNLPLNLN